MLKQIKIITVSKGLIMKNDFKFCPNCASKNITNTNNRKWECVDCGFVLYNNSATAVGVIIVNKAGQILMEVRAKEPKFGMLDVPGGFVEHGETAEVACVRECREEFAAIPGLRQSRIHCPPERRYWLHGFPWKYNATERRNGQSA